MSVKEKLADIINELPDSALSQLYSFALFLQSEMEEVYELIELEQSPAFNRLAEISMREIENGETLTHDELKKVIGS